MAVAHGRDPPQDRAHLRGAARLLEQYPDYVFIQSRPASYEMCQKHYPGLFEKVRQAVKRALGGGRRHVCGA